MTDMRSAPQPDFGLTCAPDPMDKSESHIFGKTEDAESATPPIGFCDESENQRNGPPPA